MLYVVFIPNSHQKSMKKHYYLYAIAILALVAVLPSMTKAEQGADDANVNTDSSAQTNTPAGLPPVQRPNTPKPTALEKLRAAKDAREANIQKNEDSRNVILQRIEIEKRKLGSTTPPRPGTLGDIRAIASSTRLIRQEIKDERKTEVKDIRQQGREDMKNASFGGERREVRKDMRKDEFKARKDAIVKQLNVTLNNLKQIRARISSRIDKAVLEGRDMTKAKSLLVIADGKITLAEQAVNALVALNPTASSTTATSTPSVDLGKPREVGDAAIKALQKAHEALVAVVVAIAHSMGLGNASTTPPIIPPPPVATTTTSTTTVI